DEALALAHGLNDIAGAVHVSRGGAERVGGARRVADYGGQVQNPIMLGHQTIDYGLIAHVSFDERKLGMHGKAEHRLGAVKEIVEDGDFVTFLEQHGRQQSADIAGATSQKYFVNGLGPPSNTVGSDSG